LRRVIREEISRRGTITVVMAELNGMRQYRRTYGQSAANRLPREIGDWLSEKQPLSFNCGEDAFAIVLRGGSREKARRIALQLQNTVEKISAASTVPVSVASGFTVTAASGEDPDIVLDAARAAVEEARERIRAGDTAKEPGYRAVEDLYAGWGDQIPGFVTALVEAAEIRVPTLGSHMRTVSRLAGRIGAAMGLSAEDRQTLIIGGMLHDIGKIGISDSIMLKSGPITAEEYHAMKQHPVMGAKMLEGVPELASAIPAIKYHHERFDGRGYPEGLKGEEIPLAARVIFVADAFDSMVRGRSYRPGISAGDALREVDNNSGTQFDPRIVRALWQTLSQPRGRSEVAN
jgi:HD-GYP domain-containing protein (c-di-GMP phosphodiesterase class II)